MNKFLAVTFIWVLSVTLGILIMINGWGLEVKSWGWVIGGGVFGRVFIELINVVSKNDSGS